MIGVAIPPSWRAQARHPRLYDDTAKEDVDGGPAPAMTVGRWLVSCIFAAALLLSLTAPTFAVEPSERLADAALESRAVAIGTTLRCLVCQNESIEDSNAGLAHDIRVLLRQLLLAGDSDAQARQAIVARYGEFVLLKPPLQPATYILWFAPAGLLVLGFIAIVLWLRARPP